MRIDRELLKLFIRDLRIREAADEVKLTDSEFAEELAKYLETNHKAIKNDYKKINPYWSDTDIEPFNYD
jgi:hypothetical protein